MSIIPVHEFSPITSYEKSTRDGASYKNMESQMGGALAMTTEYNMANLLLEGHSMLDNNGLYCRKTAENKTIYQKHLLHLRLYALVYLCWQWRLALDKSHYLSWLKIAHCGSSHSLPILTQSISCRGKTPTKHWIMCQHDGTEKGSSNQRTWSGWATA